MIGKSGEDQVRFTINRDEHPFALAVLIAAASPATARAARSAGGGTGCPCARHRARAGPRHRRHGGRDRPDSEDPHKPAPETEVDYRKPAIAPVIGAKPSSGVIVGVAGNVGFFRDDLATTRISSSVASVDVHEQEAGRHQRPHDDVRPRRPLAAGA